MKAERKCGADRADRITGKVKKDLSGKGEHAGPRIQRNQRPGIIEDAIGRTGEQSVGEHDFFKQPQSHQCESPKKLVRLQTRGMEKLRQKIPSANDRPRHELWEK